MKRIFIVGLLCVAGCSFKVNGSKFADPTEDMAVSIGGGHDLAPDGTADLMSLGGEDSGVLMSDMMPGSDMAPACVASTKRCANNNTKLETCRADGSGFDPVTCAYDCATTGGGAHCRVFTPSAPVLTSDFGYVGLTAVSYSSPGNYVFDTATGTITGPTGVLRAANADATVAEVVTTNGAAIGFRRTTTAAIWAFASLSVSAGVNVLFEDSADAVTSATANQYAAAFASVGAVSIAGTIDVRGYSDTTVASPTLCGGTTPGPGGGVGGASGATTASPASGSGFGPRGSTAVGGGYGASFGGAGSLGGNAAAMDPAAPVAYGTLALSPLVGGSGGGATGNTNAALIADGGGGGGAFEMVSKSAITVTGTINAGGCNGAGAPRGVGAGGGGSGGAILLEAGTITLTGGLVVANGGGGGGGGQTSPPGANQPGGDGEPGQSSTTAATGGTAGGTGGAGGNGGAAGSIGGKVGGLGAPGKATPPAAGPGGGGGGGGAAGRIRLNTTNGAATGTAGTLSPATTDTTACSVGTLNLQ